MPQRTWRNCGAVDHMVGIPPHKDHRSLPVTPYFSRRPTTSPTTTAGGSGSNSLKTSCTRSSRAGSGHGGEGCAWWPSGRQIAFGHASGLFLALAFKPRLGIGLCPKTMLNPAMAAGKGDLHRESAGIIRDDLVIGHAPNMACPSAIPKLNLKEYIQGRSN